MLLTHATIITMDANRRILGDGAILVRGDRIADIGETTGLQARYPQEEVQDLRGAILTPGFVDTHVHLAQALIRGCADDYSLLRWLTERVWVLQGSYTEEDARASASLCIAEMLKSGTTTFLEAMLAHRYGFDGIAEVVRDSGIRGTLAKIVMETPRYADAPMPMHPGLIEDRETGIDGTLAMHAKWHGAANGRIRVWFGPRTPGACSPDLYREISRLAVAHGMGITMHLAEVKADREFIKAAYGKRPVDFAEDVGLLGPNVVLAHMVWVTMPEIRKLARTGTHVSHNPHSNLKLASGVARIPEMLAGGVNVSLGCDGGPSNNAYDMVREMKLAAVVHKGVSLDPLVVSAETVLEIATVNGAKALGLWSEIGSLEVGKKADLVVFDFNRLHLTPAPNPVSTLVYAATGADVDSVMINGRWVVEGGRLVTMDEEEIIREAWRRAGELYKRVGLDLKPRWPVVGSSPSG